MGLTESLMTIRMRLIGAAKTAGEMDAVAASTRGVGAATKEAGAASMIASSRFGKAAGAMKLLGTTAKWTIGILTVGFGLVAVSSIKKTEEFAKSTALLSRVTGINTKESSRWVELANVRNVQTKQLNMGFITMAKNIRGVVNGGATQAKLFNDLGISTKFVKDHQDDLHGVMVKVADAYQNLEDGPKKAAINQSLFGRSGQALIPILDQGGKKLEKLLGLSDKYGSTMGKKQVDETMKDVQAQRELSQVWDGLQLKIGTALIPMMTSITKGITKFIVQAEKGVGVGGFFKDMAAKLGDVLAFLWAALKKAVGFMADIVRAFGDGNPIAIAFGVAVAEIVTAFVAFKTIMFVEFIIQRIMQAWIALNLSFMASPLGLAIAAIVALGVAFVIAYKKVGWFRDIVDAVVSWIKQAFPKVVDWIGGAFKDVWGIVGPIVRWIGTALKDVVTWVVDHWDTIGPILGAPFKLMWQIAKGIFAIIKTAIQGLIDAIQTVVDKFNAAKDLITGAAGVRTLTPAEIAAIPNQGGPPKVNTTGQGHAPRVGGPGPAPKTGSTVPPIVPKVPVPSGSIQLPKLHTHVWLNGREIAEAVTDIAQTAVARA